MFSMSRSCRAPGLLLLIKCLCQKTATLKGREEHKSDLRLNDRKLSHYQVMKAAGLRVSCLNRHMSLQRSERWYLTMQMELEFKSFDGVNRSKFSKYQWTPRGHTYGVMHRYLHFHQKTIKKNLISHVGEDLFVLVSVKKRNAFKI